MNKTNFTTPTYPTETIAPEYVVPNPQEAWELTADGVCHPLPKTDKPISKKIPFGCDAE